MPDSKDRQYKYRNVVRNVLSEVWAILPEKMEEIMGLLEARANGLEITEDEVRERLRGAERSDEAETPFITGGIQVIDVFGTLSPRMNLMMRFSGGTSTQKLAQEIRQAAANTSVRSIILRVDSPGGAASFTAEVMNVVREAAQEKRVVASATNMAASAAYWIASAATEFFASPSTQVGSVGVFSIVQNAKQHYEDMGVKFTVLRAGDLKAAGNPYEELTPERQQSLQDRVDDIYRDFIMAVAENRNTTVANVEKRFGQGNVFLAAEAVDRGMVDEVLTFDQVLARERDRLASTSAINAREPEGNMNPKLKAALFARGLITSMDADDNECETALRSFCTAAGIDRAKCSDGELADRVCNHRALEFTESTTDDPDDGRAPTRQQISDAARAERERVQELQTRGALLNVGDQDIQAAIDSDVSIGDALLDWTAKLSATQRPVDVVPGESQIDKLSRGASAVILTRFGSQLKEQLTEQEQKDADTYGSSLRYTSVLDMARAQMAGDGIRCSGDPVTDARHYIEKTQMMSSGSINRRGDHPDMLSALVNKALNSGVIIASTTYKDWCSRIEDLRDFKPKSFIDHGVFDFLDAVQEDQEIPELRFQSQMETWIKADRYAGKVGLTVEMIVDDDLGGFTRQLRSMGMASENTVQQSVLDLLTRNPNMLDGNAFFSAAHSNVITSGNGGTPSTTEMSDHRRLHRLNTEFGTTRVMGADIRGILAPATLEEQVLQLVSVGVEVKTPETDPTINTFRGRVMPVIDANLDAYNVQQWYTFIDPMQAGALVYAFQSGYGEMGLREDWYDPNRKTRYVSLETRFGVALANWRAMVRNFGS